MHTTIKEPDHEEKQMFKLNEIESDLRAEDIQINPRSKEEYNFWREALEDLGEPAKLTLVYLARRARTGGLVWIPDYGSLTKAAQRRSLG